MDIEIEYKGGREFNVMDGPYIVCNCFTPSPNHAAYIVNAVNNHAALVEALEEMLDYFAEVAGDCCDQDQANAEELACSKASAALAAAKGAHQ